MRIRALKAKLFLLMTLAGGVAFQAAGCTALTGDQLVQQLNAGTQTFLNSIFTQWVSVRIDGLLDVD